MRSQSSYNSGVWVNGRSHLEIPEDQVKFILPTSRDTEKLYYSQRLVIDNNVLTEPRCWKLSKINRLDSKGVTIFTCAQDKFNPNADYLDEDGWWWADYFDAQTAQPTVIDEPTHIDNVHAVITCTGSQSIKVGGSYKKLSVVFYNGEEPIEFQSGTWHFLIDNIPADSLLTIKTDGLEPNEIKIKFIGESSYIGKDLTIRYTPDFGDSAEYSIPVISL